ncbi:MAG: hypothetical protein ACREBU_14660 [Nitrososphaera sp.]
MENVIRIKEVVSADLALRSRADAFFDAVDKLHSHELVIDFSDVRSISRSFAHQYQARKKMSKKKIREIHVPSLVAKMFEVVVTAGKKRSTFTSDSIPLMTI